MNKPNIMYFLKQKTNSGLKKTNEAIDKADNMGREK